MSKSAKLLDLSFLSEEAKTSEGRRAYLPVHGNSGKHVSVFIAMRSGTYIRPHCHPGALLMGPEGRQLVVALKGRIGIIVIDPQTRKMHREVIDANKGTRAVEIPSGVYHSAVALTPTALLLEVMESDIQKKYMKDTPKPGTDEAQRLVRYWTKSFKSPRRRRSA